jgi:hypothetical protein
VKRSAKRSKPYLSVSTEVADRLIVVACFVGMRDSMVLAETYPARSIFLIEEDLFRTVHQIEIN